MRHLQRLPLIPALDIEPFIDLATVENRLVTADVLGDIVKRVNQLQPKLFALLVFED